ncbi:MAG: Stk1 family PASTA domain-containing Ser/Thr kinase [Parasporobacterium sp.]|nr:Stk1 family PASTA domain-containing Ser/Thr kinase [Parasporobacterium sp.]
MTIQKGMYIEDRYEILEKIGSGGMSDVYKARCHKLNRFVAIKFLKPEFCEDKNFVKNFRIEAQSAAALLHPNVVSVYDVNHTEDIYYIVMEYVDGITLKKYTDRNGRLPIKEATSIAIQIAQGIDAAHNANIIHRDIKPQNVLISREGKIKVTDFGIARTTTANTISTDILGSVQYISPEQARGGQVDNRTDIYSFGIVFYEMITGRLPFDGDSTVSIALKHIQEDVPLAGTVVDGVPNSVTRIIEKCTQRKPDRRYQKVSSLLSDLKTSLITPNEDFVILEPEPSDSATIIMSDEDADYIRRESAKASSRSTRSSRQSRRPRNYGDYHDYDEYDGYDDYEEYGEYDDYDEYDDYVPSRGGRSSGAQGRRNVPYKKKKGDGVLVVSGIIAGIVIIAVLLMICFRTFNPGNGTQPETEPETTTVVNADAELVPDVVGMELNAAQAALENKGFIVKTEFEDSASVQKDHIISQSSDGGSKLEKGSTVTIVVSSGKTSHKLDDYSGVTGDTAEAALKKLGYRTFITEVFSDEVEEGFVIGTVPAAASNVQEGSQIEILVSKGKETVKVVVPNVCGYSEAEALNILNAYNLNGYAGYEDSYDYAGLVMNQYPAGGEEVEEGAWVNIMVGQYPETWTEPDYPYDPGDDPTDVPTEPETETTVDPLVPGGDDGGVY